MESVEKYDFNHPYMIGEQLEFLYIWVILFYNL